MGLNKTVRVRSVRSNGQQLFIFDANTRPKKVDTIFLGKAEITFGRDTNNDIVLSSHLVSRHHGKLSYSDEQWYVTDLGSTNGIIYHDNEITEVKVGKDNFIRIDNGIETVPEGVLIIFASDEYSDTWESVSPGEWSSEYNLNRISPNIDATMERSGDLFYLNVQNPNLHINKKAASGRVVLHEKDVIACNDVRLVFSSTALYINKLESNTLADSKPKHQEDAVINNGVEENTEEILISANREESHPPFAQDCLLVANEQEPYDSGFTNEPVNSEPIQQDMQYDNNYQNQYQNSGSSATSSGGELRSFFASDVGYYVLSFAITIIIWGIAVALWTSQGELALIVILACAIFGWQALNRIQPAMFIWMPWIGWIIYIFVKFILSAMIGLFVAPFKIGKLIAGAISGSMK